jgi:hypothetical protein
VHLRAVGTAHPTDDYPLPAVFARLGNPTSKYGLKMMGEE